MIYNKLLLKLAEITKLIPTVTISYRVDTTAEQDPQLVLSYITGLGGFYPIEEPVSNPLGFVCSHLFNHFDICTLYVNDRVNIKRIIESRKNTKILVKSESGYRVLNFVFNKPSPFMQGDE